MKNPYNLPPCCVDLEQVAKQVRPRPGLPSQVRAGEADTRRPPKRATRFVFPSRHRRTLRVEQRVENGMLRAVEHGRRKAIDAVPLRELEDALSKGQVQRAVDLVDFRPLDDAYTTLAAWTTLGLREGWKAEAGNAPQSIRDLGVLDPLGAEVIAKVAKETAPQRCRYCKQPAARSVIWADGRGHIACCDAHLPRAMADVKAQDDQVYQVKPIQKAIDPATLSESQKKLLDLIGFGSVEVGLGRLVGEALAAPVTIGNEQIMGVIREFVRDRTANLVTNVGSTQRQGIRTAIQAAIEQGLQPRQAAQMIRLHVGLTDRDAGAVAKLRAALVAEGASPDQVLRQVQRKTNRLWRARSMNIARTETMDAVQEGKLQFVNDLASKGEIDPVRTRRKWLVTPDDALCPICRPMAKHPLVGLDQPFYSSHVGEVFKPPLHPQCRCDVRTVYVLPGKGTPEREAA